MRVNSGGGAGAGNPATVQAATTDQAEADQKDQPEAEADQAAADQAGAADQTAEADQTAQGQEAAADQAAADLGSAKCLNVVLLGAAARSGALGLTEADLLDAIHERLPEKLWALNERALAYAD